MRILDRNKAGSIKLGSIIMMPTSSATNTPVQAILARRLFRRDCSVKTCIPCHLQTR